VCLCLNMCVCVRVCVRARACVKLYYLIRTIQPKELVTAKASVSDNPTSDALFGVTHPYTINSTHSIFRVCVYMYIHIYKYILFGVTHPYKQLTAHTVYSVCMHIHVCVYSCMHMNM